MFHIRTIKFIYIKVFKFTKNMGKKKKNKGKKESDYLYFIIVNID